jgi:hypothetical protein
VTGDRAIRWTTAVAVMGVAAVAAAASYEHAYDLVRAHGEAGWTARLVPLTVDGLIYASSMVMPGLRAKEGAGSGAGALAAGAGHHGDARGERRSRTRARPDGRGGGRVAGGRAGWLIRTAHDGHPCCRCREPAGPWAGCLSACLMLICCRRRHHRHSRSSLRPGVCRRCAPSAPGCTSDSRGPSGYAHTSPR